jgi:hypothetical protein
MIMSEKITYSEKYKKGTIVRDSLLPERLPYMSSGAKIFRMELKQAGNIMIDGEEYEFQDIRVISYYAPD